MRGVELLNLGGEFHIDAGRLTFMMARKPSGGRAPLKSRRCTPASKDHDAGMTPLCSRQYAGVQVTPLYSHRGFP
ncbi:MAG TPA: hypothetical protein VFE89_19840, partial [Beijerinckiaceae bacterium]|nr:hypothetical protein [Beijerinckiaceae bacterium]